MSDLEAIRFQIASARGLLSAAAKFLAGSNLVELEESASAFQRLLSAHAEPSEPEAVAPTNLLADARAAKTARSRAIIEMFSGSPAGQPRDERGRYAGFDGGARRPIPVRASPEREHGDVVLGLARLRALRGGSPAQ